MTIYHSCLAKAKIVWERTGVLIGHDEISLMCEWLSSTGPEDFMDKMKGMTDKALKDMADKAKEEIKKRKRKALEDYLAQERRVYA